MCFYGQTERQTDKQTDRPDSETDLERHANRIPTGGEVNRRNTTEVRMHQYTYIHHNTKQAYIKLNPYLFALYDVRPGNGRGLFLQARDSTARNK